MAAGSFFHICLNCFSDTPQTRAKSFSDFPPVWAATSIFTSALEKAEPPACASRPTEDRAAAKPMICASDRPTCVPAAASRLPISTISLSVVA